MACALSGPILGIETSCDETAVALVRQKVGGKLEVLGSKISSQIEDHRPFGGVVPEIAARQHLRWLSEMTGDLLGEVGLAKEDLGGIASTSGPGLASSLLIGLNFGKGLALALGKPWCGINHLEGHLLSPFLDGALPPEEPHLGLIISGGHTLLIEVERPGRYRRLGGTRDDAVGEAFDKVAKMLGLPYPGGPQVERWAAKGRTDRFTFPRGLARSGDFDFSFSGLKTAVRLQVEKLEQPLSDGDRADICAGFQSAVIEVLVQKTLAAAEQRGLATITVSGGVSANQTLSRVIMERAKAAGRVCWVADRRWSTDNAVMIAGAALWGGWPGGGTEWERDVDPNLRVAGQGQV